MIIAIYGSTLSGREVLARSLAYRIAGAVIVSIKDLVVRDLFPLHDPVIYSRYVRDRRKLRNRFDVLSNGTMDRVYHHAGIQLGSAPYDITVNELITVLHQDDLANGRNILHNTDMLRNPHTVYIVQDPNFQNDLRGFGHVHRIWSVGLPARAEVRKIDTEVREYAFIPHSLKFTLFDRGRLDKDRLNSATITILNRIYGR